MHDSFFRHAGARLRFRVEGHGPALLLLHGWALDLDMWQPQFAGLSDHCRLIAFDRRGFGLSSGEPDLAQDVEDARALLDELHVSCATVVGMSQGARIALALAGTHPGYVANLLLDGAPALLALSRGVQEEIPIAQYRALIREQGIAAFREQWLLHPLMRLRNPAAEQLLHTIVGRYPARDLEPTAAKQAALSIDLALVTQLVSIVNGEFDSQARITAGDELAHLLPHTYRMALPAAGHLANLDNPAAYNELLLECVRCNNSAGCAAVAK
ncbi:alpha/beta hydrolase [Povalibacter sp.]|uniref:alpha/beta fold hydrolase n=1 Tax=Povalibacter sp. TaxID=1962978 RepID=UPI002F3E5335